MLKNIARRLALPAISGNNRIYGTHPKASASTRKEKSCFARNSPA
jgi:hypothetical protein